MYHCKYILYSSITFTSGLIKDSAGFILKPIRKPKEVEFYITLANTRDAQLQELKGFVSMYGGRKLKSLNKVRVLIYGCVHLKRSHFVDFERETYTSILT